MSRELGPHGVMANVVAPCCIADTEFFRDTLTDTCRDSLIAATHTKRPGALTTSPGTVYFLASPASRQITEQVLAVNGGERTTR
jgi:3-oxoacyl-[acyl-carrier protein] reductase